MIKTELVELLSIEDIKEALINMDCIEVSALTKQSSYYRMFYKVIGIEQNKAICVYENSWNNNLKYRMSIDFTDFKDCEVYCKGISRAKLEKSWNPNYCTDWINKNKLAEKFICSWDDSSRIILLEKSPDGSYYLYEWVDGWKFDSTITIEEAEDYFQDPSTQVFIKV
jgi:hypothetical protein